MPALNVKMVKVGADTLTKNDIFTTVLRGEGALFVATSVDKRNGAVKCTPYNDGRIASPDVPFDSTVRKIVGLKFDA